MSAIADKPVVAAFDFDGTLTRRDTLLPFLRYLLGDASVLRHAIAISPTLAGYSLKLIPNGIAKERVFVECLAGMPFETLSEQGERFARLLLPGLLREEALQRFDWHKRQGHRCIAISASLELYVQPWASSVGFDDIIATQLEVDGEGRVSGKLAGVNCFGPEKVRRLESLLGDRAGYELYAYGDSKGDRELLAMADHAYFRSMPKPGSGL